MGKRKTKCSNNERENYVTLSIQMAESTEKFSRMRVENWKDLWLQPCRAAKDKRSSRKWLQNRTVHQRRICLLNPCNVVAQLVSSQPVTVDTTVTFFSHSDVLGSSRITRKNSHHPLCTAHLSTFCVVSHSYMVAEHLILVLVY